MIETSKALSTAASALFYQFPVSSMPFQGLAICREVDLSEVGFMAPAPMRLHYTLLSIAVKVASKSMVVPGSYMLPKL